MECEDCGNLLTEADEERGESVCRSCRQIDEWDPDGRLDEF